MSIAFGGIIAFVFRGMNLVVALATILVTSRMLTEEQYGTFVLGLTVVGITNAVTGGITAATAYQVANQRRAEGVALANGGVPAVAVASLGMAAGAAGAAVLSGDAGRMSLPVALAAAAVILNSLIAGVFLGRESFVRYNLALVMPPLFALAAIVAALVAVNDRTPELAMSAYAAGQWTALVLLFATSLRLFGRSFAVHGALVREIVRFAVFAGMSSGISYLNYRADLFVVSYFEGKSGAATYSAAVYIAESVWQVSGSLTLATYARLGSLRRPEAVALTTRVMRHTIVLIGALCLVLLAGADLIQEVAFPDFDGMASALRWLLPGVLLYSLAQSFSGFYTYQRGLPWVAAVVAGTGLAVDMVFAFILVPRYGVDGASMASSIAYSTAILAGLAVFVRQERLRATDIFRFGRADLDDYRALVTRVRSTLGRA
jgi:O-antigen/teichoic acid export membrane protein